ncbi:MAG: nucleotide exchange factor GrpE [Clostridia bacterium]|nr:nucleotide exchange factor GrpE [Clostridia bacterium]
MSEKAKKKQPEDAQPEEPNAEVSPTADVAAPSDMSGELVTLTQAEFEQVKAHIEQLQTGHDSAVAALQRSQADFANYKRRNAAASAESFADGKADVIRALLPVIDDFERALECETPDKAYSDGVRLVYRRLTDELAKLGVREIPTDGGFDPNLHEAVMREESEQESGSIIQVLRKGYMINDRIIRHSMVKVAE